MNVADLVLRLNVPVEPAVPQRCPATQAEGAVSERPTVSLEGAGDGGLTEVVAATEPEPAHKTREADEAMAGFDALLAAMLAPTAKTPATPMSGTPVAAAAADPETTETLGEATFEEGVPVPPAADAEAPTEPSAPLAPEPTETVEPRAGAAGTFVIDDAPELTVNGDPTLEEESAPPEATRAAFAATHRPAQEALEVSSTDEASQKEAPDPSAQQDGASPPADGEPVAPSAREREPLSREPTASASRTLSSAAPPAGPAADEVRAAPAPTVGQEPPPEPPEARDVQAHQVLPNEPTPPHGGTQPEIGQEGAQRQSGARDGPWDGRPRTVNRFDATGDQRPAGEPARPETRVPGPEATGGETADNPSLGRLIRAARMVLRANGGTAHVRLEPPGLGTVKLDVTVREGLVSAWLSTQTRAAAEAVTQHLPALRAALERQGLAVEHLDVSTEERPGGGSNAGGLFQDGGAGSGDLGSHPRGSKFGLQGSADSETGSGLGVGGSGDAEIRDSRSEVQGRPARRTVNVLA